MTEAGYALESPRVSSLARPRSARRVAMSTALWVLVVHLGGNVLHTGQLYFADTVTDAVYRKAPYASRP